MTQSAKRSWGVILIGVGLALIFLTAASTSEAILTTNRVATGAVLGIGMWALYTAQQFFQKMKNAVEKVLPRLEDAMYGPQNHEGKRSGGLVGDVGEVKKEVQAVKASCAEIERLSTEVGNAVVLAATAADAVRELQDKRANKSNRRRAPRNRRNDERRTEEREDA